MKKHTYLSTMLALMRELTETEASSNEIVAKQATSLKKYHEVEINFDYGRIKLIFELGNLYLQGFRNKNGDLFIFKDVDYLKISATIINITTDYDDLGLDRAGSIRLGLEELSNALNTLLHTLKTDKFDKVKKPMWQCAVGLSEALRFHDVSMAVMNNQEMPSLDWSRRTKSADFRVRVKHR